MWVKELKRFDDMLKTFLAQIFEREKMARLRNTDLGTGVGVKV